MFKSRKAILVLLSLIAMSHVLIACGQTGRLYLPKDQVQGETQ